MSDVAAPPKGQMVLDRLKKRLEGYRNHHDEVKPRFEHTINGVNEEQKQQTNLLRQRYVESKAKKSQKKGDKKSNQDSTGGVSRNVSRTFNFNVYTFKYDIIHSLNFTSCLFI